MSKFPKILSIVFINIFILMSLQAQKSLSDGDKYKKNFDFINAIEEYKKALNSDVNNVNAIKGLASSYRHIANYKDSEYWYGRLVELEPDNKENLFYYAQALMSAKKYDKALTAYKEYNTSKNVEYVSEIINGFDYITDISTPNPNIDLRNATTLNTDASDFGIAFKNISEAVFCSTRPISDGEKDNWTHQKFTDLYSSVVSFDEQSAPDKFNNDQYNGMFHDGPATFHDQTMYLTRSFYVNSNTTKSKSDKTVKLKMLEVDLTKTSKKIKKVSEEFSFNSKEYSVAHATVSPDGNVIVFSSDAPDFNNAQGATDLYIIYKGENGEWSEPENLSSIINTPSDEEFPFLADENTLYFASDGHYGVGGLDIYRTTKSEGKWSTPENIGAPFNTSFDDFNYVYNDQAGFGFLSSNRPGGLGSDDIYAFKAKDGTDGPGGIRLKVLAYDEQTLEPLESVLINIPDCIDSKKLTDSKGKSVMGISPYTTCVLDASLDGYFPKEIPFSVFDKDKEIEIPLRKIDKKACSLIVFVKDKKTNVALVNSNVKLFSKIDNKYYSGQTNEEGYVEFIGIQPNAEYELVAIKDVEKPEFKYLAVTEAFNTNNLECPSEVTKELYLDYVQKGVAIKIENIYYDLDKYYIRPDAAIELDKIVKIMRDNPTMEIELGSHTDCRARWAYNETLSTNRAKAAVEYMVTRGISASRMIWKGYGESKPVNGCACEPTNDSPCSEQEHQMNRRTEFTILKF